MPELPVLEPGASVSGADLSTYEWTERDLADLVLTNCTLVDAQLSAVILQGARFTQCRFIRCRFAHADLREASFVRCRFDDPDSHSGVEIAFSHQEEPQRHPQ